MKLDKIRELVKFDDGAAYEGSFVPENISAVDHNYFKAGARYQHAKLLPIIEGLLKVVEMQGKALERVRDSYECPIYDLPPQGIAADMALTEAASILEKMGEGT